MDNLTQSLAGTAVGLGSLALVGQSMRMIPPEMMQTPKVKPMKNYKPRYKWNKPVGVTAIPKNKKFIGSGRVGVYPVYPRQVMYPIKSNPGMRVIVNPPMNTGMNFMGAGRKRMNYKQPDFKKQNQRFMQGTMGIMVGVPLLGAAAGMIHA